MPEPWKNQLYFGDNLEVLRKHIPDESVDLVYLDPPFNSNATYNILFSEKDGTASRAQVEAFKDAWAWTDDTTEAYWDVVTDGGKVADLLQALCSFLGRSTVMAYLTMMAVRLVELHRVLKETGSIYLHCDPTASHYIKLLMDAVFGVQRYRNEIVWKRAGAHSDGTQGMRRYGRVHDVILFYSKSDNYTWNAQYLTYEHAYLSTEYRHRTPEGRAFKETDLTAAKPGGNTDYVWRVKRLKDGRSRWVSDLEDEYLSPRADSEYKAVKPYSGRYWAYSVDNLKDFARHGRLIHRQTGMPRLMQFADEMPGTQLQDIWTDIPHASGRERLGYPTQKPEILLERIIQASSIPGDILLDPFCGCGTAVAVSDRLDRRWIGIDITYLAIDIIKRRLARHRACRSQDYRVVGEPEDLESARALSMLNDGRLNFEHWAVSTAGARPSKSKQRSDGGIDGFINVMESPDVEARKIIAQAKSGHVGVKDIRDLVGTMQREKAIIGAFITLEPPTKPMLVEATSAGYYSQAGSTSQRYPCVQIITVGDLFRGKRIEYPGGTNVVGAAVAGKARKQGSLI